MWPGKTLLGQITYQSSSGEYLYNEMLPLSLYNLSSLILNNNHFIWVSMDLAEHSCFTKWGDYKSNKITTNVGFWWERKNQSDQSREPTNSTHIRRPVRVSNPSHIGGERLLSPLRKLYSHFSELIILVMLILVDLISLVFTGDTNRSTSNTCRLSSSWSFVAILGTKDANHQPVKVLA